jgi:hypothetical protein
VRARQEHAIDEGGAMTDQTTDTAESTDSADARDDAPAPPESADPAPPETADPAPPETADPADVRNDEALTGANSPRRRLSISVGVRSLVIAAVIAILAGAVGTLAWLYIDARRQLDEQASESADKAHAEKVALDYAVNAATMDFKDLQAWKVKLVAGTSPELNKKLTDAAVSMEQIMVPLQWSSSAEPLVATVRSRNKGTFIVDCFVSVQTKTVQAPEALASTATYSITIDSKNNWLITDVGGVGSVVGPK